MSNIVTTSQFTGKYSISAGIKITQLTDLLNKVEERILRELMGNAMYVDFIADLSGGVPVSPEFVTIFNPLLLDNPRTFENYSNGMRDMVKGFVWYDWNNDTESSPSTQGQKKVSSSNSKNIPNNSFQMNRMYNESIGTYKAIQDYIKQNLDIYPDFKGVSKKYLFTL